MMLKLAIISDIHHGRTRHTKLGDQALPLLREFIRHVDRTNPDFVVELGDRISDVDYEGDKALLAEVAKELNRIQKPKAHLLGNHDVGEMSVTDNETILGVGFSSRSVDVNGYHLVFWNCNTKMETDVQLALAAGDCEWLRQDLAAATLPTIIFTHIPLDNGSMIGNFYFEKDYPMHAQYGDAEGAMIREIIETSGKVILCVNGHAHWNHYAVIDGIHYVTIPSLTESFTTFPHANEAWADIVIDQDIVIDIHGRTLMSYRLPIKNPQMHWVNNHKAYAPKTK